MYVLDLFSIQKILLFLFAVAVCEYNQPGTKCTAAGQHQLQPVLHHYLPRLYRSSNKVMLIPRGINYARYYCRRRRGMAAGNFFWRGGKETIAKYRGKSHLFGLIKIYLDCGGGLGRIGN